MTKSKTVGMKTLRNLKRRVRNLCRQYDRLLQTEAARASEEGIELPEIVDEETYLRNKGFVGLAFLCEAGLKGWAKANKNAIARHFDTNITPTAKAGKVLYAK